MAPKTNGSSKARRAALTPRGRAFDALLDAEDELFACGTTDGNEDAPLHLHAARMIEVLRQAVSTPDANLRKRLATSIKKAAHQLADRAGCKILIPAKRSLRVHLRDALESIIATTCANPPRGAPATPAGLAPIIVSEVRLNGGERVLGAIDTAAASKAVADELRHGGTAEDILEAVATASASKGRGLNDDRARRERRARSTS